MYLAQAERPQTLRHFGADFGHRQVLLCLTHALCRRNLSQRALVAIKDRKREPHGPAEKDLSREILLIVKSDKGIWRDFPAQPALFTQKLRLLTVDSAQIAAEK